MIKKSSRKKSTILCAPVILLFSLTTFLIYNRVDDLGFSQESFHSSGCWFILNFMGLLSRECWISWTVTGYNSWLWPCYNNSWDESLAPGDQIRGFYLKSGLYALLVFGLFFFSPHNLIRVEERIKKCCYVDWFVFALELRTLSLVILWWLFFKALNNDICYLKK